jgi:UDP-glucuronate 4-epimerase
MKNILVTGTAGFIGFHTAVRLLERGLTVTGLDNMNAYYDVRLKEARLAKLQAYKSYRHLKLDLVDRDGMAAMFAELRPSHVIHLAAQAGVRYSLEKPETYVDSNLVGFLSVLEGCRHNGVEHLVFASTSSVYGANTSTPFSVTQSVDHPMSIYAATKKANEAMAHSYAHLFKIPVTGLRFFTVYGPWGRPDMALFKFTQGILADQEIEVYGQGQMSRDFTYVDDIVTGVIAAAEHTSAPNPHWDSKNPNPGSSGVAPYRIFNLGNSSRVELMRYISVLEKELGKKAKIKFLPMQPGDVPSTEADTKETREMLHYAPSTPVEDGIARFVAWYRAYYNA